MRKKLYITLYFRLNKQKSQKSQKVNHRIFNLFNLFKIVLKVPNFLFIKKILRHEIPIEDFDYSISKKQLYLKRLKVSVHKDKNLFVLNGYNLIINLIVTY